MTERHKFSLKKLLPAFAAVAVVCAVTWKSNARRITPPEIYSTLTADTSSPKKKDSVFQTPIATSARPRDTAKPTPRAISDSLPVTDSTLQDTSIKQRVDTLALKFSKDTLDAPVTYEAEDSAVVMVNEKKILLYGKTKTVYKEMSLEAPKVEMDQQTNLISAFNSRDSLGDI